MIEFDPHHRIDLTGPWAGFSFLGDRLITPEGRELLPEDLAWLSLTACQAQEWRRMMEAARSVPSIDSSRNVRNRSAGIRHHPATVVNLRDVVSGANSGRRWRWLVLTPSHQRQTCRYRGRCLASACEALP